MEVMDNKAHVVLLVPKRFETKRQWLKRSLYSTLEEEVCKND